jgi:2-aminoadipate transaminase
MSKRMKTKFGLDYSTDEIIITSGSQQGLDKSGMAFIDPGDIVLFESPSYLGAVNALHSYQAELVAVPTDREGLTIEGVEAAFEKYGDKIKLIYVDPDHQNPTGRSWSDKRRREFMEFMAGHDVPVLEDAAYGELSFEDVPQRPLAAYDKNGQVIYVGTFSKIFCPGLRVAWLCARKRVMDKYITLKSAADLSSSTIAQWEIADFLEHNDIEAHIAEITDLYKHRCDVMAECIRADFPAEVKFEKPKGGIFIWLELPEGADARRLYKKACDAGVAFIPGTSFYPNADRHSELRLNFSNTKDEETREGIKILGDVTKDFMAE